MNVTDRLLKNFKLNINIFITNCILVTNKDDRNAVSLKPRTSSKPQQVTSKDIDTQMLTSSESTQSKYVKKCKTNLN